VLPKDAPPYQLGSLKREELVASNSVVLHELYFANLGGNGHPDGDVARGLGTAFGSLDAWEHDFRVTGLSLAGGSGWVVLAFDPGSQDLHNWWAWDHTNSAAGGVPLLVMDMYEHSYAIDYGANAKSYIDAFLQNVNWDEVNHRRERAAATQVPR
jgi:Fe-Mn family superoxide dismutase